MYGIFMKAGSFIKTGTIKKVSPNYFTGKASLQIISGTPKPKEADVLHVKFHKGARTKIHAHTSGQMLIVTGGTGSLITYSGNSKKIPFKVKIKEKIPLRKGSIAYVPAGTLHTHGSVKKSEIFSHIALNLADKRGAFKTLWYESDLAGMVIKKI